MSDKLYFTIIFFLLTFFVQLNFPCMLLGSYALYSDRVGHLKMFPF